MSTLFVYYKLPRTEHAHWLARVQANALALTARWPGLQVELMQRPEVNAQDLETWMEIYRHPDGVGPDLMRAIEQEAQQAGLPAPRAHELFVPLRPQRL